MKQAGADQFADDEADAARVMKVVHVARTIGVYACEQRDRCGQVIEIAPVHGDARRARDRRDMDRVIGRSAGCQQRDDRVDDRLFIDAPTDRSIIGTIPADIGDTVSGGAREFGAQPGPGTDEGGGGHVQPHRLEHHLVRVGGTVESARAGIVIARTFGLEQLAGADLPFGEKLADALLFLVREARRHRSPRHEDRRQMSEAQRADQQTGDDLVAYAEQ